MTYNPLKMLAVLVLLIANVSSTTGGLQEVIAGNYSPGFADGASQANEYDVVVIGGTPAGVAAAIAAARADKTVIIIEQSPVLGGVLSSGVLRLDDKYVESNSGVMEEFRQRVKAYHRTE